MAELSQQELIAKIQCLYAQREQLLVGQLAPEGAWVHEYSIYRTFPNGITHEYRYAKWQSQDPIFARSLKKGTRPPKAEKNPQMTAHKHIGRVWSSSGLGTDIEVVKAYQAERNRKRLEKIDSAIKEIDLLLERVLNVEE